LLLVAVLPSACSLLLVSVSPIVSVLPRANDREPRAAFLACCLLLVAVLPSLLWIFALSLRLVACCLLLSCCR
jgi:hypothetical protein